MQDLQDYINKYGEEAVLAQMKLEDRYKAEAMEAMRKKFEMFEDGTNEGDCSELGIGRHYLNHEFEYIRDAIKTFWEATLKPKTGAKKSYINLMMEIEKIYSKDKAKMLDVITFSTFSVMLSLALRKTAHNSSVAGVIADDMYNECRLQAYVNAFPDREALTYEGIDKRVQVKYRNTYVAACLNKDNFAFPAWNKKDSTLLAGELIQVVLKASSFFEDCVIGSDYVILPSEQLLENWEQNKGLAISRAFRFCPTIIPPREWQDFYNGGYYGELAPKATLLRLAHTSRNVFEKDYLKRLAQLELSTVRKAVNAIQATPWKIDTRVLNVIKYILDKDLGRCDIPLKDNTAKLHELKEELENIKKNSPTGQPTPEQLKEWKKKMTAFYSSEATRRSLMLRVLFNVKTAEEFANYEQFYIPCNMDFRGRIYGIPPFNFQGDKLNKSLMLLANTPAIQNQEDLKWFYVTGANLAGIDKVSFEDRIKWVMDNEHHILSVAEDPLSDWWWEDQDSPWQFLQFCFEYKSMKDYMASHNGSIVGWQTGLVIAFDGTCSGLQHFSAILRDPVGGKAVNLVPQDKPNDIYQVVADKVNKVIEKDVLSGTDDEEIEDAKGELYLKRGTKSLALIWHTHGVTRSVTKRCVMTLAYGSKEYGFKNHIYEDTIKKDLDSNGDMSVFSIAPKQCAAYLAKLIWEAVGTTVVAAVEGMKWLQSCAKAVCQNGKVVTWVTPAGLPVQQYYMSYESRAVQLRCAGKRVRIYTFEATGDVDKRHQVSGVAPNFIHSMDASHLQLTTASCVDAGIHHYSMVHDSYGTCLANAEQMFRIVKQEFVKMYVDNDVFSNFREDLQVLSDKPLPSLPAQYDLELEEVLESPYLFC